jgi:hypothetical protein
MLRSAAPLAPAERLLYSGATVRRWARTFARSADRATLRSCLRRGLAAGVRTRPRPTADLLAAAGLTIAAGSPAVPAGEPPLAGRPQAG